MIADAEEKGLIEPGKVSCFKPMFIGSKKHKHELELGGYNLDLPISCGNCHQCLKGYGTQKLWPFHSFFLWFSKNTIIG